jgi:rhomboid protease GluP
MASTPPEFAPNGQTGIREPEILPPSGGLPPTGGYAPPQPPSANPVRRRKSPWAAAPATHALVGINCGIWLAMVANHISPVSPTVDQLMNWGANNAGAVLLYGQWWRIVAAMFLHVGIIHLATNMWCLWNLGLLAEPLMGSLGLVAAYILTGAAGNLLSTLVNWIWPIRDSGNVLFPAGAGASGAVFGIAGLLIVLLKSDRLPVPPRELKKLRKSVIYFAAINLIIGFSISFGSAVTHFGVQIDNMAHLGGFSSGLLMAMPLVPRIGSPRDTFETRLRIALGMMVGLLVLFGFFIAHVPPPQP